MKGIALALLIFFAACSGPNTNTPSQTYQSDSLRYDSLIMQANKLRRLPNDSFLTLYHPIQEEMGDDFPELSLKLELIKGHWLNRKSGNAQEQLAHWRGILTDPSTQDYPDFYRRALIGIQNCHKAMRQHDSFFYYVNKEREHILTHGPPEKLASAYSSLSLHHLATNNYVEWESAMKKMDSITERYNIKQYKEFVQFFYARGYLQQGKIEAAKVHVRNGLAIGKANGNSETNYTGYTKLARIAYNEGEYEKTLLFLDSVTSIPNRNVEEAKHDFYWLKVNSLFKLKRYKESLQYTDSLLYSSNPVYGQMVSNTWKYQNLKGMGRYEEALTHHEESFVLYDSLEEEKRISKAQTLEKEIAALKQGEKLALANQEKSFFKRQRWIFAALGVALLLIPLLYISQRNKKRQKAYEAKLAQMQVASLKSQMSPHFMFNSINTIKGLIINEAAEAAADQLTKFSKLMRSILNYADNDKINLGNEIEFLKQYTELEQFKSSLQVRVQWDIAENLDLENDEIPPFLIQPFIENAFKHAFDSRIENPILNIGLRKKGAFLLASIEDNGIGAASSRPDHHSKGSKLVEQRLALHNGKDGLIQSKFLGLGKGCAVEIKIKL